METDRTDRGDSQEFVMTLLAIFGRGHGGPLWSGGLVQLLNDAGYSTLAARAALNRLVGRNLLERVRNGRFVYYEITLRCADLLAEGDRRLFALGNRAEWDGAWTMVWHTLPETRSLERNRLARRLRFLGFRPMQDSIWLSPYARDHEVRGVAAGVGVSDQIGVLVGASPADLPVDRLIERTWDLDGLCVEYERFADRFGGLATAESGKEAFLVRARAAHAFRQFAFLDPEVPDRLLPRPDARRRAAEAFRRIMSDLERPARRHFDAAMSGSAEATATTDPHGGAT
ncbi:MAG: PaaX family transcriptional regulator [Streptosporangiales bacterium]|nr:PaaX family transcriptional regulator [Streptosporangiales bacterium]